MLELQTNLKQRSDYTHKFNVNAGRYGWLRLTPAYSVKMVEEIISRYESNLKVLDPFCGTGTTALSAIYYAHMSTTVDINPFLVWLAQVKTAHYSDNVLETTLNRGKQIVDLVKSKSIEAATEPSIYKIERWWCKEAREFLCFLKGAIIHAEPAVNQISNLLKIAFCRTLIEISNVAFNHQSMSFKDEVHANINYDFEQIFFDNLSFVVNGARDNPSSEAGVILGDSRNLHNVLATKFDLVITSPPYANRMSYIRELRPYMYWLGYLANGKDAGILDWSAIGGTWGIATSRLMEWKRDKNFWFPRKLNGTLKLIANGENANGKLLAQYVEKYCSDMILHFYSLRQVLNEGARVHYIVGNSTFYGNLVATEQIYAEILKELKFIDVEVTAVRKRNSKKELFEFDVSATWPGPG
ncbi:MAG: hypothetical protein OXF19_06930 [Hyphomicrobiales bacterium]|nr:hypothetical protein [Hyphomicrobiales bacterium]